MARRGGLAGSDDAFNPQSNELQPLAWPLPCRRRLLGGAVNVGLQPKLRIAVDWAFCHDAKYRMSVGWSPPCALGTGNLALTAAV
jgi:hypothetical protein